jgi:DNA-binding response OmpR family regulator
MKDNISHRGKILIVDDEPNVLRMVGYTLHTEGFEVIVAQSGSQALSKIQTEAPDLVILDVMMPDMSGIEVCEHLRNRQATLTLPIIMLSASSQVPDKVKCFAAGADEYIVKPITPEELIARVKALLLHYQQVRPSLRKQPGKVFGFIGAKGGVGTTSIALNIATVLALQQKKVLAVEIRSTYGTFSAQLNLAKHQGLVHLCKTDLKDLEEREINMNIIDLPSGLKLLVGPQDITEYGEIEPQQLEAIIRIIASMFEYTILDISCLCSGASQAAIQYCDLVALIVEPESAAIASGIVAADQIKSWGVPMGKLNIIVVNRAPLAIPRKLDQITNQLEREILGVIPNAADSCIAAQNAGLPIVMYRPDSDIAKAYLEITKRITESPVWVR